MLWYGVVISLRSPRTPFLGTWPPKPITTAGCPEWQFVVSGAGKAYDAREPEVQIDAFGEPADRHVGPLEGGTVVACDRASFRQGPCVHSVYVVAARRDCSG